MSSRARAISKLFSQFSVLETEVDNVSASASTLSDRFSNVVYSEKTGTSYTLALSDSGQIVYANNANANTITVPPNSSVAFPVGAKIDVVQTGAGTTTIAAGSGVTINSADSALGIGAQYGAATLVKTDTDTWLLIGNLA